MAKVLVFRHLFWFVLSVVFITGATRISVFGLGYLLACFFFLLFGTQLLVKPSRTRLALWDCLIIYNVAVIISKNMLSVSIQLLCGNFLKFKEYNKSIFIVSAHYSTKFAAQLKLPIVKYNYIHAKTDMMTNNGQ